MEESKCGCCRWCCCSKEDFFPEESFKSWKSYGNALKETKSRLTDRFLARSQDEEEVNQMRARSKNEMKKSLTWWDLLWFGIGSVMGAGIFVLTGQEANGHAGPAVVLSFAVSGFAALLSVFCYTEFAVDIPVAGGSFAYIRVELGDFVAFVAAGNILFEYVVYHVVHLLLLWLELLTRLVMFILLIFMNKELHRLVAAVQECLAQRI